MVTTEIQASPATEITPESVLAIKQDIDLLDSDLATSAVRTEKARAMADRAEAEKAGLLKTANTFGRIIQAADHRVQRAEESVRKAQQDFNSLVAAAAKRSGFDHGRVDEWSLSAEARQSEPFRLARRRVKQAEAVLDTARTIRGYLFDTMRGCREHLAARCEQLERERQDALLSVHMDSVLREVRDRMQGFLSS